MILMCVYTFVEFSNEYSCLCVCVYTHMPPACRQVAYVHVCICIYESGYIPKIAVKDTYQYK